MEIRPKQRIGIYYFLLINLKYSKQPKIMCIMRKNMWIFSTMWLKYFQADTLVSCSYMLWIQHPKCFWKLFWRAGKSFLIMSPIGSMSFWLEPKNFTTKLSLCLGSTTYYICKLSNLLSSVSEYLFVKWG